MKRSFPTRRAMTAIELLVATLLASLMLAAVVGVLGGLARQSRQLRAGSIAPEWQTLLTDQLTWDLHNAREIAASAYGVRLVGYGGRNPVSDRPTGRLTDVYYFLVQASNDCWLIRRERERDAHTNIAESTDIVCRGVSRMEFGSTLVNKPMLESQLMQLGDQVPSGMVPNRSTIRLYAENSNVPTFDETLLIR